MTTTTDLSLQEQLRSHYEGCGEIKKTFDAASEATRQIIQKMGETVLEYSLKNVTSAVDKARRGAQLEDTETTTTLLTIE